MSIRLRVHKACAIFCLCSVLGCAAATGKDRDQEVRAFSQVKRFYNETILEGYDATWLAPPDPALVRKSGDELLEWLSARSRQLKKMEKEGAELSGALLHAYGRVAVALRAKYHRHPGQMQLLESRFRVLEQSIYLTCDRGRGPLRGLKAEIDAFRRDAPAQRLRQCMLMVGLIEATIRAVEMTAPLYHQFVGGKDMADLWPFLRAVRSGARAFKFQEMQSLYRSFHDSLGADLVAVHLVQHYWHFMPQARNKARRLLERHRKNWEANPVLRQLASREIGDVLASVEGLEGFALTDVNGKEWRVDELRGQITMLFFFSHAGHIPPLKGPRESLHERVRILGIPVLAGQSVAMRPGFTAIADPRKTDVHELQRILHVHAVPYWVLVTPELEVVAGWERIASYLNEHFPRLFEQQKK